MDGRTREARAQKAAAEAARISQAQRRAPESSSEGEGVDPKPEGERPPSRNEPRRLAMEEIEARHAKTSGNEPESEAKVEPVVKAEPVVLPAIKPAVEPVPRTPDEILAADAKAAAGKSEEVAPAAVVAPEPIKMAKVKVDGQEFEVPQADVDAAGGVTAYQKDRAADNRLRKTNETLAETRRTQAQIAQWIQQQTPKQPTLTDDQFIQSKVDIIRFGTPEESAVALREVMQRSNPRLDANAITQQAVTQMQQNMAVDNFKKEFQDVVANPMLLRLAVSLENERRPQAGPQTDWPTFYRTIGNEVRSVVGRQSQPNPPAIVPAVPATPTADSTSPVDKEARKASIVNLPTAAARAALPAESKPETREDILNQMRKTRGIPTG